jgi:hypothetical protein
MVTLSMHQVLYYYYMIVCVWEKGKLMLNWKKHSDIEALRATAKG